MALAVPGTGSRQFPIYGNRLTSGFACFWEPVPGCGTPFRLRFPGLLRPGTGTDGVGGSR